MLHYIMQKLFMNKMLQKLLKKYLKRWRNNIENKSGFSLVHGVYIEVTALLLLGSQSVKTFI